METPVQLIMTGDGSHSLKNEKLNETYHSTHGAIQESMHVFVKKGLEYWTTYFKEAPVVLEIGFGTGLNALLTLEFAESHAQPVCYETLETYPLCLQLAEKLNFASQMQRPDLAPFFKKLHEADWNKESQLTPHFTFLKRELSVQDYVPARQFNLIYFDAFAPSKQPEMWTLEVIKKMADLLVEGGILVTYCAQGQFKRNLKEAGFEVESLPGPPFKKEMVRAVKK